MSPSPDPDNSRKTAVALSYELGGDRLPRVVASGRGTLADKILEIAFASGVKVREDRDLAELLAKVEIDSDIPTEALIAVAEILNYIYRVNGKLRAGSTTGPEVGAGQ
ncbi:MAG: flagellar protein FhlB [Rhodospirillales bacterium]|nr:flagellar protein FhlB [Rhodospirillales bacterium]